MDSRRTFDNFGKHSQPSRPPSSMPALEPGVPENADDEPGNFGKFNGTYSQSRPPGTVLVPDDDSVFPTMAVRRRPRSLPVVPDLPAFQEAPGRVERQEVEAELSPEQKQVLTAVLMGTSVFFTGCAGTGKSFLLNRVRMHTPCTKH